MAIPGDADVCSESCPNLEKLPVEVLAMILDFSETQDLFKISRVCRNVYSAALVVLRGRISSLRDGPGFNVALRIREPVMLAPPVYRQCRYVGQVQAQRYYDGSEIDRRGGLARCCDVFFRMIPSACDETPEGVTVKAVTIINTVHPPEINRSSPIEYSLDYPWERQDQPVQVNQGLDQTNADLLFLFLKIPR
ncbi:F-box domain, cyclin-like protein [Ascosphaera apis ARSEF 7405]|uniref:F-box domain, cyclin-like protein n=1 Tax=Ascosphaera apis ARSEF 7405 TaxID=392613 RepID=A0A167ZV96_9EURO|nr:F-box domain, cyclin-like protein [Ascosphaera apis ARSEF 7405]